MRAGLPLVGLLLAGAASAAGPRLPLPVPDERLPASEALAQMADDGAPRSIALADAVLAGDVPRFLKRMVPVRFEAADALGAWHTVEVWVTPDYLAVGTERDWVYAPLGYPSATRVARGMDALLPTPALVDRIHAAAVKLEPAPIPPSNAMRTTGVLFTHQGMVEPLLPAPGQLVAGHKKDVVIDARLAAMPDRVAIYGWHHPDGTPIQPVSLWHGLRYADYSHGVRLVSRTARVDGDLCDLADVLVDPVMFAVVSDTVLPESVVRPFEIAASPYGDDADSVVRRAVPANQLAFHADVR